MKKILNTQISVKTLLIVMLVAALSITAMGAAVQQIQATLSPDVTIRYQGEVQDFRDANNNAVYPILYRGTTYLPLRALSNMLGLPIDWEGSTRTVWLGQHEAGPRRLVDHLSWTRDSGIGIRWASLLGAASIPQPVDDFGNSLSNVYTHALKSTGISTSSGTGQGTFSLDVTAATLTFDFYADVVEGTFGSNRNMRVTITDIDSNVVLYENRFEVNRFYRDIEVELRGAGNIGIGVVLDSLNSGVLTRTDAYILNPTLS